ncbi:MAG TPA: hypothetical protein VGR84_18735 [Candidatus Acidoferrales bacterium]|nr:hypothetical protein [Candidatus Acidoferrales bacterium]
MTGVVSLAAGLSVAVDADNEIIGITVNGETYEATAEEAAQLVCAVLNCLMELRYTINFAKQQ